MTSSNRFKPIRPNDDFVSSGGGIKLLGLGFLALVAFSLGVWGFISEGETFLDGIYLSLQLFVLESGVSVENPPLQLQIARFIAPAIAVSAIVATVLLLLTNRIREARIRRWSGHVVICGLSSKGMEFAQRVAVEGRRVVVVELREDHPLMPVCKRVGVPLLVGDASDPSVLVAAGAQMAFRVIVVCGSDAVNAEVVLQLQELRNEHIEVPQRCLAHIVDPEICLLLRASGVPHRLRGSFEVDFFNIFEVGASRLVTQSRTSDLIEAPNPQIAVIGLEELGRAVVTDLGREVRRLAPESTVTIIGFHTRARDRLGLFEPELTGLENPRIEAIDISPVHLSTDHDWLSGISSWAAIFVCLENDAETLGIVLGLGNASELPIGPVMVAFSTSPLLAQRCQEEGERYGFKVETFNLIEEICTVEMVDYGSIEVIARTAHELYLEHQLSLGLKKEDNPNIVEWADLGRDARSSNYALAWDLLPKLEEIGCTIIPLGRQIGSRDVNFQPDEIEHLAIKEHERWVAERQAGGWSYGPRDDDQRMHPDLIDWAQLEEGTREKDRLFIRNIPALLERAGYQVVRMH